MTIDTHIAALACAVIPLRRAFHQNPQLGFEETFANEQIRKKLNEWRIPHESGLAGTGIVATIESSRHSGAGTIGLRADMDALPIAEQSDKPWRSRHEGVMHACGHDGHMAILLGTAAWLQAHRDQFAGTVKLIFQPAEEGVGGARRMIAEGLFERHPVDAIFALHNWPDLPVGRAGMRAGAIMASYNTFTINVTGKASHAAYPARGINAGAIASEIFTHIHTRLPDLSLGERFAVAPTIIQAGTAKNIIPGTAVVQGSIRALSRDVETALKNEITALSHTFAVRSGGRAEVDISDIGIATVNDAREVSIIADAARDVLGARHVDDQVECAMTAEDFCFMLDRVPGAYIWLGQGVPGKPDSPHNQPLHNNRYEFNDVAIAPGIGVLTRLVERRLPVQRSCAP